MDDPHSFPLLLEIVISIFESNRIREPIPDTPKIIQETHPSNSVPLEPLWAPESVLSWVFQRREPTGHVWECAHTVMEPEIEHNMPSTPRKSRNADQVPRPERYGSQ